MIIQSVPRINYTWIDLKMSDVILNVFQKDLWSVLYWFIGIIQFEQTLKCR